MGRTLVICLLVLLTKSGIAQLSRFAHGIIEDSTRSGLSHATIILTSHKDTTYALSSENGSFAIRLTSSDSLELSISMKGYLPYKKRIFDGGKGPFLQLPPVILQQDYADLEPATVTRIKPLSINGDTTTYRAGAFPVRDGAEVESLLKILPGIEVDMNGNVIVQGKKVSKLLVDGKEFFGGDVLTAIRNLPADIVDKLQIIDDYGDKARLTGVRTGEPAKVLNLTLQPGKRNGSFGRAEGSEGDQGKYVGSAFANAFKEDRQFSLQGLWQDANPSGSDLQRQASASYANQWGAPWMLETNGNFSSDDPHSSGNLVQDNFFNGGNTHLEQSTQNNSTTQQTGFGSTLTYKPNPLRTLRISPSLSMQHNGQYLQQQQTTIEQDSGYTKKTVGNSINQVDGQSGSAGTGFYFEQLSTTSKKRFSIDGNISFSNNRQHSNDLLDNTVESDGLPVHSLERYLISNNGSTRSLNLNATYFLPTGKAGFFEFGYSWRDLVNRTGRATQEQDSLHISPTLIDSLSQDLTYRTADQRIHAGYSTRIQALNLSLGLDAQPGRLQGSGGKQTGSVDYTYLSVLPVIQANYFLSKTQTISFQYRGSSSLPNVQQLQPFTDLTNPQYPVTGNPDLRSSYTQNLSLHYEQSTLQPLRFHGFGLSAGYTAISNVITADIIHPKDSSIVIQKTTYVNAGGARSWYGDYHVTLPPFWRNRIRITLNGSVNGSRSISVTDDIASPMVTVSGNQGLHLQWIIPNSLEYDLGGNYTITHTHYPSGGSPDLSFASAGWSMGAKHYFLQQWIFSYQGSQTFTGGRGEALTANPPMVTASLQREFLKSKKYRISLTAFDLFNSGKSVSQAISAASTSSYQAHLTGRYFMFSFLVKWGKFK